MSEQRSDQIAVLGAGGMMGFPIARNLSRAGFEVRAWNRSREKAEPLSEDGAAICDSAAEAAREAEVVLTMLADADAVLSVAEEAFGSGDGRSGGPIWLQCSTIGEQGTERRQALAEEH